MEKRVVEKGIDEMDPRSETGVWSTKEIFLCSILRSLTNSFYTYLFSNPPIIKIAYLCILLHFTFYIRLCKNDGRNESDNKDNASNKYIPKNSKKEDGSMYFKILKDQ